MMSFPGVVRCDHASSWQRLFQDPATPIREGLINLHHDIRFVLFAIGVFVCYRLFRILSLFVGNEKVRDQSSGEVLEIVWTVTPAFILRCIGVPSFALLYSRDEVIDPAVTLQVIGHQWYWTYVYADYVIADESPLVFDSYRVPTEDLPEGGLRLLEVDQGVVLPVNTHIRVLVTAADVLHCWAVPSLGVKMDACPGRLNQVAIFRAREGTFYGQCSELCGVGHGFRPIVVQSVPTQEYRGWISNRIEKR